MGVQKIKKDKDKARLLQYNHHLKQVPLDPLYNLQLGMPWISPTSPLNQECLYCRHYTKDNKFFNKKNIKKKKKTRIFKI